MWRRHGTKFLGAFTALLGTLALMTPAEFQVIGVDGHTALRVTVIASGLLTIIRGFVTGHQSTEE